MRLMHVLYTARLCFSFTDIKLRPDNGVPTEAFLDACEAILPVFGKFRLKHLLQWPEFDQALDNCFHHEQLFREWRIVLGNSH